ncbi:MAG: hypothetical protein JOY85_21040 [Acidobacteriaceae bacterium]|nr:hypothetical protein [Acidobacteriaceae bacterium]
MMPSRELVRNEQTFAEIVALISSSRIRALQAVNTALVELYWQVGEIISKKLERAEWGDGVVEELAQFIARTHPGLRGFTRANLFRMRQFYETYRQDEKVAPLVRQLPWSHNLVILGQTRRSEEREFYLRLAVTEGWSRRELERQMRTGLFERTVLSPPQVSPVVRRTHPNLAGVFRDSYLLEFLELEFDQRAPPPRQCRLR